MPNGKKEAKRHVDAIRRRLSADVLQLWGNVKFFNGPSAWPPSLHREWQKQIAEALKQLLRRAKDAGEFAKRNPIKWARATVIDVLKSLPDSRQLIPLLLPLLDSVVDEEILRETADQATSPKGPRKSPAGKKYKSTLKRHIRHVLTDHPDFKDSEICDALDEEGIQEGAILVSWRKNSAPGARELSVMYRDDKNTRHKISVMINKVRADLELRKR